MFARLKRKFSNFRRDQRGAVFIIVAVAMPVIFGAAAASIDMGHILYIQSELRAAADAAALAATDELDDEDAAKALAVQYAELNMPITQNGNVVDPDDVILGNWDTDTSTFTAAATPTNAVQVTARRSSANGNAIGLYFAKLIGFDSKDVSVLAVASVSTSETTFCILSLSDSGTGVTMNGSMSLTMPNCGMAVSSGSGGAFTVNGSGTVTAEEICVAGTSTENGTTNVTDPTDNCSGVPSDPLAGLDPPAIDPEDCDEDNFRVTGNGNTVTISPGTYCGGITIAGSNNTVIMESGEYIIAGGGISATGGTLTDDGTGGVYIYNTGTDDDAIQPISFGGTSSIDLDAQTSGTYSGVLFHMDTGADFNATGTGDTDLNGTIYAPDNDVEYSGTASQSSSCLQIISNTVTMSGTSDVLADPDDPAGCNSDVVIADTTPPRLRD
ncbi:MAG: hypothetical protein HOH26_03205 [Alphaproteobacteria bacterium]|nr:hypothetical protein [Alphaproteobacteria bacterium]MBT5160617.1 hypothetical protein [Alphaproteobacteria bacterium]MBT5917505.1 hypothetical protein [Alphaproteobacteria bacterium]